MNLIEVSLLYLPEQQVRRYFQPGHFFVVVTRELEADPHEESGVADEAVINERVGEGLLEPLPMQSGRADIVHVHGLRDLEHELDVRADVSKDPDRREEIVRVEVVQRVGRPRIDHREQDEEREQEVADHLCDQAVHGHVQVPRELLPQRLLLAPSQVQKSRDVLFMIRIIIIVRILVRSFSIRTRFGQGFSRGKERIQALAENVEDAIDWDQEDLGEPLEDSPSRMFVLDVTGSSVIIERLPDDLLAVVVGDEVLVVELDGLVWLVYRLTVREINERLNTDKLSVNCNQCN